MPDSKEVYRVDRIKEWDPVDPTDLEQFWQVVVSPGSTNAALGNRCYELSMRCNSFLRLTHCTYFQYCKYKYEFGKLDSTSILIKIYFISLLSQTGLDVTTIIKMLRVKYLDC